jgi:hypothetical protein
MLRLPSIGKDCADVVPSATLAAFAKVHSPDDNKDSASKIATPIRRPSYGVRRRLRQKGSYLEQGEGW